MSSPDELTAEQRFRQAFERLKAGTPKVLKPGSPVSQSNVAKEAECDPSALRKSRYPSLIREIQAYMELRTEERPTQRNKKRLRRSVLEKLRDAEKQRDKRESLILSLMQENEILRDEKAQLQRQLDELLPPPTPLVRR